MEKKKSFSASLCPKHDNHCKYFVKTVNFPPKTFPFSKQFHSSNFNHSRRKYLKSYIIMILKKKKKYIIAVVIYISFWIFLKYYDDDEKKIY